MSRSRADKGPIAVRLLRGFCLRVVRLYPRRVRELYVAEQWQVIRERERELPSDGLVPVLFWLREARGLLRSVAEARGDERRRAASVGATTSGSGIVGDPLTPLRSLWRMKSMDVFRKEVRTAMRGLARAPQFTLLAVLFLALGVGGNVAMFSVVYAVLLGPLPYQDSDRLAVVSNVDLARADDNPTLISTFELGSHQAGNSVFESVGGIEASGFNLTGVAEPRRIDGARVSAEIWPMLVDEMALGRYFGAAEDRPGADPVVVVSHSFWVSELGADPKALGTSLTLDGMPRAVVGVLPAGFRFPTAPGSVWTPLQLNAKDSSRPARMRRYLMGLARLKEGVTVEQATENLKVIMSGLARDYPDTNTDVGAKVLPLRDAVLARVGSRIVALQLAAVFVLLIVCANMTHLLLIRTLGKSGEIAVRAALGASRWQMGRQVLVESLLLAAPGGALGVLLAYWSLRWLIVLTPLSSTPLFEGSIGIGPEVVGFSLLITLVTALLCGLAPWLLGLRLRPHDGLKQGGRSMVSGRGRRLLEALAVLELAMALVLVVGAGLMLRSFDQMRAADTGFEASNTVVMQVSLPSTRYGEADARVRFVGRVLERIRALPGVLRAGTTTAVPLRGTARFGVFNIEGRPPVETLVYERLSLVSPELLETLGARLLEGRLIGEQDHAEAAGAVVVSDSFARKHFPDGEVIGQRLQRSRQFDPEQPWLTVVGVIDDVRFSTAVGQIEPSFYLSYPQRASSPVASQLEILVRFESGASVSPREIQREVWKVDNEVSISDVSTLEAVIIDSMGNARFTTVLATLFAGLAFVLGLVGVYGVVVHFVQQSRREIGVRMVLGADAGAILSMVLRRGSLLVVGGIVIGLGGASALTRLLESQLYEVSALDPVTLVAATGILGLAALSAFAIPARRATRVSPTVTLRGE